MCSLYRLQAGGKLKMATTRDEPSIRIMIMQCTNAKLQIQAPSEDGEDGQYVEIHRGIVLLLCFMKGATLGMLPKAVKAVLNVRLSEAPSGEKVSILELPGDILIVPQSTLGAKIKGKRMQYHFMIDKQEARQLYKEFCIMCKREVMSNSKMTENSRITQVKFGTYGIPNCDEVLSLNSNGIFTHVIEM